MRIRRMNSFGFVIKDSLRRYFAFSVEELGPDDGELEDGEPVYSEWRVTIKGEGGFRMNYSISEYVGDIPSKNKICAGFLNEVTGMGVNFLTTQERMVTSDNLRGYYFD